jgi:hypothetical protein
MRCSASNSEAVHRWSGTVQAAVFPNDPGLVFLTIPGLQRIIALRSMLRCARETGLFERPSRTADDELRACLYISAPSLTPRAPASRR